LGLALEASDGDMLFADKDVDVAVVDFFSGTGFLVLKLASNISAKLCINNMSIHHIFAHTHTHHFNGHSLGHGLA